MANIWTIDQLLTGENRGLFDSLKNQHVADIGGADGDLAFFYERLGASVDLIDYPPTNYNALVGAKTIKNALQSNVTIIDQDLDANPRLPRTYGFANFLGILYHLKDPYRVMESLSSQVLRLAVSTRISDYTAAIGHPDRTFIARSPIAYLLHPTESNNDPTNYWVFSEAGLRRLLERTGWRILDFRVFGDRERSDPYSPEADCRAFCYLETMHTRVI